MLGETNETNEVVTEVPAIQTEKAAADPSTWRKFEATAYTARCYKCSGITRSGVDVRKTTKHNGRTVIAVDPKVIPLGSDVDIRLADGTIIEGTALDTGGKIRGKIIDILHANKRSMREFGRQTVEVRVIEN